MRSSSLVIVLALMLAAGCGPRGEQPAAPPPSGPTAANSPTVGEGGVPSAPGANAPSAAPSGRGEAEEKPATSEATTEETAKLQSLPVDRNTEISVPLRKHSLAVVEYYDRALAARGWKKREPKADDEPGHREWLEMPVPAGPTDLYDAAWVDPKTGRIAVLNLFHTKEKPELQQGTFEIHPKGHTPWKQ